MVERMVKRHLVPLMKALLLQEINDAFQTILGENLLALLALLVLLVLLEGGEPLVELLEKLDILLLQVVLDQVLLLCLGRLTIGQVGVRPPEAGTDRMHIVVTREQRKVRRVDHRRGHGRTSHVGSDQVRRCARCIVRHVPSVGGTAGWGVSGGRCGRSATRGAHVVQSTRRRGGRGHCAVRRCWGLCGAGGAETRATPTGTGRSRGKRRSRGRW
mmetsp:Transcript_25552/g.64151  ORF Transcript_25552/g.64151 Transcript_25552/m.64151 type:complete len:215 (+) Transcript_25552:1205-1849(+)